MNETQPIRRAPLPLPVRRAPLPIKPTRQAPLPTRYIGELIVLCMNINCSNPVSRCKVIEGKVGETRSTSRMCSSCLAGSMNTVTLERVRPETFGEVYTSQASHWNRNWD